MAMAINSLGHQAIGMRTAQIGIVTDSTHTKARVLSISTDLAFATTFWTGEHRGSNRFPGIDAAFNIATALGRGGGQRDGRGLGGAGGDDLRRDAFWHGVYTTNPRRPSFPRPRKVRRISWKKMLELATAGAGVMPQPSP